MKSIQNQYRDLKEGKMSQANFMRSLRMTFPQYVTNVTSFNDSVRILKNKGILTENKVTSKQIQDKYNEMFGKNPQTTFADVAKALGISEQEIAAALFFPASMIKEIKVKGKIVTKYSKNGDGSYNLEFEDGTEDIIYVSHDDWDIVNDDNLKKNKLSEAKTKLHPNQIHPQELRMGIKVEMEHTDDPKKAEKIALDHLAENPFYYTALKLSGIESPSAPKAKAPAKAKAKKESVELVDKENQMKTPKGVEKAKASANKAHKETNKGVKGVEELTHAAKKAKGIKQVMSPTGGKMKTIREQLEKLVREMLAETFDGRDNLDEDREFDPYDSDSMANFIAQTYGEELKQLAGKEKENQAFRYAYTHIVKSGIPNAKIVARNLMNDDDWAADYITSLFNMIGRG